MSLHAVRRCALFVTTLVCAGTVHTAIAGSSLPAVAKPNLTVGLEGGTFDGHHGAVLNATASAPVGHSYGVQVDGLLGGGNHGAAGIGGHFFYRDPQSYLLGVTAMHSDYGNTQFQRYGVESEIYFEDFTLAPAGGLQRSDDRLGNSGFYTVDGNYYPQDNIKLTVGSTGYSDVRAAYGVAEWQPEDETPLTFYGYAGKANEGDAFAMAGIRYTFGATAGSSIKLRDRTGDPSNIVKTAINYVGSSLRNFGTIMNKGKGNFANDI